MSVEVVFETHSLSVDNERGIATGWLPGSLSETGQRLARELGERRRADDIDVVFTSDLHRAVETAQIAFLGVAIRIYPDARLRECNYGAMNGMPASRLAAERPLRIDRPFPGGESWRQAVGSRWSVPRRIGGNARRRARSPDRARSDAVGARPLCEPNAARGTGERAIRLARGLDVHALAASRRDALGHAQETSLNARARQGNARRRVNDVLAVAREPSTWHIDEFAHAGLEHRPREAVAAGDERVRCRSCA